jgi:hypothetical protein
MRKKPYLPSVESQRVIWLNNFASKIGGYAVMFGITPAELTLITKFAAMYAYIIGLLDSVDTFKQNLTKYKNKLSRAPFGSPLGAPPTLTIPVAPATTEAGIFTVIGGYVQRIKAMKNVYTTAIGEDLGIVGDETTFDPDTLKIEIKGVKITNEGVKLEWVKGESDGTYIYSRVNGVGSFTKLAFDGSSPYIDTRPLSVPGTPETREYMTKPVLNDVEIGLPSDVVSVVVGS